MKASELKAKVEATGSLFFTRKSMKFFGDTMANYGVRSAEITTYSGDKLEVWELYRKHPVKHGLKSSAYFTKDTFKKVRAVEE